MAEVYLITSGARPTSAVAASVSTTAAIRTLIQVKLGRAILRGKVIEWGISFDSFVASAPIVVELLTTKLISATVTAHVAGGIINVDPLGVTPTDLDPFDFGTAATGFDASAEGTVTDTRPLDPAVFIADTNQFVKQFPLGREPEFGATEFLRLRVDAAADVESYSYVFIEV